MSNPVLLIADANPARLAALMRRCEAHRGVTVLGAASPGEAYVLIESHLPRRVAFSAEFAEAIEFDGLSDILAMIDADVCIYGPASRVMGRHRRFAGPDQMLDHLLGAPQPLRAPAAVAASVQAPSGGPVDRVVLLGASTGGITAIETVLSAFRPDSPPVLIVQHIRPGFAEGLVRRLDQLLAISVVAAGDAMPLRRGTAYLACDADRHLGLVMRAGLRTRLISGEAVSGHRPSVDVLFSEGAALADKVEMRAALLTGMGADGARGMGALRRAGALTIAQDRDSSVVWGMPRVAVESGAAAEVLPLPRIGAALLGRETARARRTS